jgi:hypothetical protein
MAASVWASGIVACFFSDFVVAHDEESWWQANYLLAHCSSKFDSS